MGSGDAIGIISLLRYSTCKQRSQESKHLLSYHIMVCDNSFTIFCSRIKLLGKSSKNCFEIQGLSVNSQVLSIVLSVICLSRCSTPMSLEDLIYRCRKWKSSHSETFVQIYAVFDAWPIIHPIVLKSYVTLVSDEVQLDSHKVEVSKSCYVLFQTISYNFRVWLKDPDVVVQFIKTFTYLSWSEGGKWLGVIDNINK